jgi:hypothetical protein
VPVEYAEHHPVLESRHVRKLLNAGCILHLRSPTLHFGAAVR